MFTMQIVDSDAFLEMPISSQMLYFHLAMRADDDGFIGNPKKIMRMIGCGEDDMKILLTKRFILAFPSGVIVIKHWLMHNYIKSDRYNPTQYIDEKMALVTKENRAYTECPHSVPILDTQVRVGKVRLGKEIMSASAKRTSNEFEKFWNVYPKKEKKKRAKEIWLTKNLDAQIDAILSFIEKYKKTDRFKEGFIKQPTTFLNGECWNDDINSYNTNKQEPERTVCSACSARGFTFCNH